MAAGSLESWPEIIWGLFLAFKISSFYWTCFERKLCYYDHDDGGVFDALQEEKGRPEGLLKHGRHVAVPGHTRRLPPDARSLPDDVSVAQFLTEKDNAR